MADTRHLPAGSLHGGRPGLSLGSFIRTLIPFTRAPPSWPNHPQSLSCENYHLQKQRFERINILAIALFVPAFISSFSCLSAPVYYFYHYRSSILIASKTNPPLPLLILKNNLHFHGAVIFHSNFAVGLWVSMKYTLCGGIRHHECAIRGCGWSPWKVVLNCRLSVSLCCWQVGCSAGLQPNQPGWVEVPIAESRSGFLPFHPQNGFSSPPICWNPLLSNLTQTCSSWWHILFCFQSFPNIDEVSLAILVWEWLPGLTWAHLPVYLWSWPKGQEPEVTVIIGLVIWKHIIIEGEMKFEIYDARSQSVQM